MFAVGQRWTAQLCHREGLWNPYRLFIEKQQFNSLCQSWERSVPQERCPGSCVGDVLLPLSSVCSPGGDEVALARLSQGTLRALPRKCDL